MAAITHAVPVRYATGNQAALRSIEYSGEQDADASGELSSWNRQEAELMTNFSRIAYCPEREILDWSCATCNETLSGFEVFYKERENIRHVGVYAGIFYTDVYKCAAGGCLYQSHT